MSFFLSSYLVDNLTRYSIQSWNSFFFHLSFCPPFWEISYLNFKLLLSFTFFLIILLVSKRSEWFFFFTECYYCYNISSLWKSHFYDNYHGNLKTFTEVEKRVNEPFMYHEDFGSRTVCFSHDPPMFVFVSIFNSGGWSDSQLSGDSLLLMHVYRCGTTQLIQSSLPVSGVCWL